MFLARPVHFDSPSQPLSHFSHISHTCPPRLHHTMEPNSTMASSHKAHLPVAEKPDREALLADLNGVDYKEIPVFFEKNELIVYHPRPRRAIARTNPIFTPQGSSSDLSERSNEPVTARNTPTLASTGPVLDSPGIHHDRDTSPDLDFGLSDPEYQHQLSSRRFNQTSGVMTHEETTRKSRRICGTANNSDIHLNSRGSRSEFRWSEYWSTR